MVLTSFRDLTDSSFACYALVSKRFSHVIKMRAFQKLCFSTSPFSSIM